MKAAPRLDSRFGPEYIRSLRKVKSKMLLATFKLYGQQMPRHVIAAIYDETCRRLEKYPDDEISELQLLTRPYA